MGQVNAEASKVKGDMKGLPASGYSGTPLSQMRRMLFHRNTSIHMHFQDQTVLRVSNLLRNDLYLRAYKMTIGFECSSNQRNVFFNVPPNKLEAL